MKKTQSALGVALGVALLGATFSNGAAFAGEADALSSDVPVSGSVLGGEEFLVDGGEGARFTYASAANGLTALLDDQARVYSAGANNYGQLGLGDTKARTGLNLVSLPKGGPVPEWVLVTSAQTMFAGGYAWGNNTNRQITVGHYGPYENPYSLKPVAALNARYAYSALDTTPENVETQPGTYFDGGTERTYTSWGVADGVTWTGFIGNRNGIFSNCAASKPYRMDTQVWSDVAAIRMLPVKENNGFNNHVGDYDAFTGTCASWLFKNSTLEGHPVVVESKIGATPEELALVPNFPKSTISGLEEHLALPDGLFLDVSSRGRFGVAVSDNNVVYTWGDAATGALGREDAITGNTPEVVTFSELAAGDAIIKVSAGHNYSLALSRNGDVFAWGQNSFGNLGTGDTAPQVTPVKVASNMKFIAASDQTHSIAIDNEGTAWSWGDNTYGQLAQGDNESRLVPTPITGNPAPAVMFGDTAASVSPAGDGINWVVTVPAHVPGKVDVTIDRGDGPEVIGTHTYTFTVSLGADPSSAEVGSDVSLVATVSSEEALWVEGVPFDIVDAEAEGTRAAPINAVFAEGQAVAPYSSDLVGVFPLSGSSTVDGVLVSNIATTEVTFYGIPAPVVTTAPPTTPAGSGSGAGAGEANGGSGSGLASTGMGGGILIAVGGLLAAGALAWLGSRRLRHNS